MPTLSNGRKKARPVVRLHGAVRRYGWRTPLIVAVIVAMRLRLRSRLLTTWVRAITFGAKGSSIEISPGFRVHPGSRLEIGDSVFIGERVTAEINVANKAKLAIGSCVWISRDCVISALHSIEIGNFVLIGEFVSIRDSTHESTDVSLPIRRQADRRGWIRIEHGAWIGRGCLIQGTPDGVVIGEGAIVGANSIVTRSIPAYEIWGGVPAHFIKKRGERSS